MAESLLELVALVISSLRVNFGKTNFFFAGVEVVELGQVYLVDVNLVEKDEENGRDGRDPLVGSKAELEADSCAK